MSLKREISQTNLLLLSIGSVIGSGWLFGSFYAAQTAGPASVLSWIIGGFFVLCLALPMAEVATLLPFAGGSILYTNISHGKATGIIISALTWLWTIVIAPMEVQAMLQYSTNFLPSLGYKLVDGSFHPSINGYIFIVIAMLVMIIFNILGVKSLTNAGRITTLWKLSIPTLVIIVLISYKPEFKHLTAIGGFAPNGLNGILSAISNSGICLAYFGFQTTIFLGGEAKNPQKSIPFALFMTIFVTMIIYALLQLGFIVSIPTSGLEKGWGHINFIGDAGPFAGIFLALGITIIVKILFLDAIICPLGTGLSCVAMSSRVLYSMSLQKEAPSFLGKVSKKHVPVRAILINFAIGMLFFLPFSGWQSFASFIAAAIVLSIATTPICLPIFRKYFPDIKRPFKLPFGTVISFLSFYISNLILHWTGWNTIWKMDIALILCASVTILPKLFSKKNRIELELKSFLWFPLYIAFVTVSARLDVYSSFKDNVSFDLISTLFFSGIIYVLAIKSAIPYSKAKEIFNRICNEHSNHEGTKKEVA